MACGKYTITSLREHFAQSMTCSGDDPTERYRAVRGTDPCSIPVFGVYDTKKHTFAFKTAGSPTDEDAAGTNAILVDHAEAVSSDVEAVEDMIFFSRP